MRWVSYGLLIVLALLQYRLWFGDDSLPEAWRLQREISNQELANQRYAETNAGLRAEVEGLKTDAALLEEYAREELGFIRRGESYFLVIE